jgi:hypothetical protein
MTRAAQQHTEKSVNIKDSFIQSRRPVRFRQEVFREVCDWYGERLGIVHASYNGTIEDALRVAEMLTEYMFSAYPEARNGESRIAATDEYGRGKWIIAPNFKSVAEAGTPEAAYINGDLSFASVVEKEQ